MFLGIEIGGTKLQLGVGDGAGGPIVELVREDVDQAGGAAGILRQVEAAAARLLARHRPRGVGIGFGGPVDPAAGRVIKSHHVDGWDGFALAAWCERALGLPAALHNDCDCACLAEACSGAGEGCRVVLYVTVGTGIGGGLVIDRQIYRGGGAGAAEIGHLRVGLHAVEPSQIVESLAAGWGIAAAAQARVDPRTAQSLRSAAERPIDEAFRADLLERCQGRVEALTAKIVAQAAGEGNELAREVVAQAVRALGWAIAQALTLMAPEVVVIGGGVSLMDDALFFAPLADEVARYVFPPLLGHYRLAKARLGESVVVHGALAVAAAAAGSR